VVALGATTENSFIFLNCENNQFTIDKWGEMLYNPNVKGSGESETHISTKKEKTRESSWV